MIDPEELSRLQRAMAQRHDPTVLQLASMYLYLWQATSVPPWMFTQQANLHMLSQCLHARLTEIGAKPKQFEAAVIDLRQTQDIVSMLVNLPEHVDDAAASIGWQQLMLGRTI